jgi:hypothetical protein
MFGLPVNRLHATGASLLLSGAALAAGIVCLHRPSASAQAAAAMAPITVLPAVASGVPQMGPGYFTVTAVPNQTVSLHALVLNRTRSRPVLALAPVDAYWTGGGLAYRLPNDPRQGVGAWLTLPERTVDLAPTGRRLVDMRLHVPAHTAVGTYTGALSVALPNTSTLAHGAASIHVQMRLAVAIVVHVRPGSHT